MSQPPAPALQPSIVGRLLGGLILCIVLAVYISSRWHGHWPPSHPWSGIALTSAALIQLFPPGRRTVLWMAVLCVCSSLMWAFSAHLANH